MALFNQDQHPTETLPEKISILINNPATAFPEVKAVADEITLHHKEDGVASTLARIFLDKK